MKKLFILFALIAFGAQAYANDGVTAGTLSLNPGESGTLDIYYTGQNKNYISVEFYLYLPDGLSIATDTKDNVKASEITLGDVVDDHGATGKWQSRNKRYKFMVESDNNYEFVKSSGLLMSVIVTASSSISKGMQEVKIELYGMADINGEIEEGTDIEIEKDVVTAVGGFPVAINSAGYATACSAKALDFSAVDGVEAVFTVSKVADNTATLSPIESKQVPAEAGVVVKGTSGTVFVPFAEGSVAELGPNELIGVTSATSIAEGCYILQGEEFVSCIAGTLPAGKAYLPATVGSSGAKAFTFDFGDATGINEVKTAKADGAIYSISGVRVAEPQKGVYIMNGRKVIVK